MGVMETGRKGARYILHKHVYPTVLLHHCINERFGFRVLRHIRLNDGHLSALSLDAFDCVLSRREVQVAAEDLAALLCKYSGCSGAVAPLKKVRLTLESLL